MQIVEGLCCLHDQQFLHLDLKPHNILWSSQHGLILCDFGLSIRATTQRLLEARKVTIWYRPPELIMACTDAVNDEMVLAEYDETVDLWSLGAIIWDFMASRPMLSFVKILQNESPDDMLNMLYRLGELLGTPNESEILDWRGTPEQKARLRFPVASPRGQLKRHLIPQMRSSVEYMPEWFQDGLIQIMEELFSWRPRQRPGASLVLSKLGLLHARLEKVPLALTLPSRCCLKAEEVEWRQLLVRRPEVESWWKRAQWVIDAASQSVQKRYVTRSPTFTQDPDSYLDVLVLACELIMRVRYQQGDSEELFSDEKLHMACTTLAVQLTRPWWPIVSVYGRYKLHVYEQQQVEIYVCYTLNFKLYTENVVTEAHRRAPYQRLAYHRVYETYMGQFKA